MATKPISKWKEKKEANERLEYRLICVLGRKMLVVQRGSLFSADEPDKTESMTQVYVKHSLKRRHEFHMFSPNEDTPRADYVPVASLTISCSTTAAFVWLQPCSLPQETIKQTDKRKDKQPVQATGKKGKGKQVGNQRYIKGYRVNILNSKLVYRAVVKSQGDNVASNMGQSLNTTKKPSPSDSLMNGMSSFTNDDISLQELRNFVDKSMQEETVLEQVGNYDINGCTSREKQGEKVLTKKPRSSMEVLNEDSDTDVEEVFIPNDRTTFPSSSGGGGQPLEEDAYDDYEDQFEDYPSLHQVYDDQFDLEG